MPNKNICMSRNREEKKMTMWFYGIYRAKFFERISFYKCIHLRKFFIYQPRIGAGKWHQLIAIFYRESIGGIYCFRLLFTILPDHFF